MKPKTPRNKTPKARLAKVRPPKAKRLAVLGVTALEPGEVSVAVKVRLPEELLDGLKAMTAQERGDVLAAYLRGGVPKSQKGG
jgi:hypothetical protein